MCAGSYEHACEPAATRDSISSERRRRRQRQQRCRHQPPETPSNCPKRPTRLAIVCSISDASKSKQHRFFSNLGCKITRASHNTGVCEKETLLVQDPLPCKAAAETAPKGPIIRRGAFCFIDAGIATRGFGRSPSLSLSLSMCIYIYIYVYMYIVIYIYIYICLCMHI